VEDMAGERMVLDVLDQREPGRLRITLDREVDQDDLGVGLVDQFVELLRVDLEILGGL